jgi:hypothetical protein
VLLATLFSASASLPRRSWPNSDGPIIGNLCDDHEVPAFSDSLILQLILQPIQQSLPPFPFLYIHPLYL